MQLSKQQEAELLTVYESWWSSYLTGDVKTYDSLLADDYHFVGSTNGEEYLNRKDTTAFFKATAHQMAGKAELRNLKRTIEALDGGLILITDVADAYIITESEWVFYSRFRFSSLLRENKNGWRFIYQHFSAPDTKAQEGETLGTKQITKENQELRDAIKRRTVELENKNRELEIEAATERVRVQSMAMQHPNDLEKVNKELLHQLTKLRIDGLSGVSFYFVDQDEIVTVWDLSSPGSMNDPNSYSFKYDSKKFPFLGEFVGILKSTQDEYFVLDFPKEKLLVGIEELKEINITIYKALKNAVESGALLHQWNPAARITDGILSIDLMKPPNDDTKTILLKMAGAFNQAYTRFLDLQKAEAQAREAQIQLALERVRARSLAMHHTSELQEIVEIVAQQLQHMRLNINGGVFITINVELNQDIQLWASLGAADYVQKVFVPLFDRPIFTQLRDAIKKGNNFFNETYSKEEKDEMFHHLFHFSPWNELSAESRNELLSREGGLTRTAAISQNTSIVITNHNGNIFSTREIDILKRFGSVFEQSYTRFLDLQKAEAQTREAQIETALEKVRSRTMGMRQSHELGDVATVLFKELNQLVENLWTCGFVLCEKDRAEDEWWLSTESGFIPSFYLPNVGDRAHENLYRAWKDGKSFHAEQVDGADLTQHYEWLMKMPVAKKIFDDFTAAGFERPEWQKLHGAYFSKGYLCIITRVPCGEEEIFKRFAQVFDLTYTRFLDLQKAEAQAREAEIELALERVRARTMAMQRSEELVDVATVLFQQVKSLGVPQWNCGFNIWTIGDNEFTYYPGSPDGIISPSPCKIPLTEHPIFMRFDESRKRGDELLIYEKEGEDQADHYRYMLSLPEVGDLLKSMLDAGFELPKFQIDHLANFAYGNLIFITYEHFPKIHDVFKRFAKVFEQTYTRFLDLQKAEAQTREAEIQLALERVRARSLAMHHTSELQDTVSIVAEQLQHMGLNINGGVFITINEELDQDIQLWASLGAADYLQKVFVPFLNRPIFTQLRNAIKKGNNFFDETYSKEEKDEMFHHLFHFSPWNELSIERKGELLSREGGLTRTGAISKYTSIVITNHNGKRFADQEIDILKRFGSVFEQSYTRFLDLQKAEAQAREAQIEVALERVRAASMAMHSSNDLLEVIKAVTNELIYLGINFEGSNFVTVNPDKSWLMWICTRNEKFPFLMHIPYFNHKEFLDYDKATSMSIDFYTYVLSPDENAQWMQHFFQKSVPQTALPEMTEDRREQLMQTSSQAASISLFDKITFAVFRLTDQPFTNKENDIFKRIGKAFEQAYIRFLDLQKAEAQSREAQINLAVERVRARALAMYKSEEILELVFKLKQEMMNLDIPNVVAATIHLKEKDGNYTMWDLTSMEYSDGKLHQPMVVHYQLEELDPNLFIKKMWDNTAPYFLVVQDEEGFKRTIQFLRDCGKTKEADDSEAYLKNAGIKYGYHPTIPLHNGRMCIDLLEPPSDEIEMILTKMGAAFDLAYKRFEDLKNSEKQLREAQIEAALEKVRSRTMGMHISEELREVIQVIHDQLVHLGFVISNSGIMLDYLENDDFNLWIADSFEKFPVKIHIPFFDHPQFISYKEAKEKGLKGFRKTLSFEEKNKWFQHIYQNLSGITDETKQAVFNSAGMETVGVFLKNVGLYLINYDGKPYSDEENDILIRFGNVFEQSYTRFLDLKKAEAQAREAQIETALERIRSKSLAMYKTDDLGDVVTVLFTQMQGLNVDMGFASVSIFIFEEGSRNSIQWIQLPDGVAALRVPYFDHPISSDLFEAKESGADYFAKSYTVEEKNSWVEKGFELTDYKKLPDVFRTSLLEAPGYAMSITLAKNSGICIPSFVGNYPSGEDAEIMKRVGKVFEQAYIRFLDLQKAEAQTREAQIEAGLERVRSRSLAMHNTSELQEVINTVHKELLNLNIAISGGSFIAINSEIETELRCWGSGGTANTSAEVHIPLYKKPFCTNLVSGIKNGPGFFTEEFSQADKKKFFTFLFKHEPWSSLDDIEKKETLSSTGGYSRSCCVSQHTSIFIINHFGDKFSDAANDILKRFAKVFEQTYTRFLDLQKAEAQAREAKIEAALEKVRSRTMAMQKGEELKEVAVLLYKELIALGVNNFVTCGYVEINEKINRQFTWVTSPGGDTFGLFYLPLTGDTTFDERYAAWKQQQIIFHQTVAGEVRSKHLQYAITTFNSKEAEEMVLSQFPDPTVFYCFNFSHGYLHLVSGSKLKKEEELLLVRFTRVFEQTYARFLDLKKAEAQARESQIQLALERVRARTMAMQKSEELEKCAVLLFQQIGELGINAWSAGFSIWQENDTYFIGYNTNPTGGIGAPFRIPLTEDVFFKTIREAKRRGEEFLVFESEGESLVETYRYMDTLPVVGDVMRGVVSAGYELPKYQVTHCGFFSEGHLMFITLEPHPEAWDIFKRFTKVFEQTYTRFLDLQKAEAQAREAQIETSLERVRSRSMGMQKSEELKDVIKIVYQQITQLKINCNHAGFVVDYRPKGDWHFWIADEQDIPGKITHPYFDSVWANQYYEAKEKGVNLFATNLNFEEKNKFYNELLAHVPELPQASKDFYLNCSGLAASTVLLEDVGLYIENFSAIPYTDEENNILLRFGKVFQQTYTRFLDLQNAEAQTREAQIEAALEKARSRSMSMQSSDELPEVANVLFLQIQALGIPAWSCGYNIFAEDKQSATCCMSSEGTLQTPFKLRLVGEASFDAWGDFFNSDQTMLVQELADQRLDEHYSFMKSFPDLKPTFDQIDALGLSLPTYQINHICKFNQGFLLFITYEKVPQSHDIFKRFTRVFEQTYTRFSDLKQAEAQAREARIEAAMEKVRGRAMAMQKPDELVEVAQLLRKEMGLLGVEELETSSIYIHNEDAGETECWYAIKDIRNNDNNLVSDHMTIHLKDTWVGSKMLAFQHSRKKQISIVMQGENRKEWINYCAQHSRVLQGYYGDEIPERSYHLVKFSHGFIGAASPGDISDESWNLLHRATSVFSLAYTRFSDLQKAEAQAIRAELDLQEIKKARLKAEEALVELQATQKQLIQSEKMASLGELTAGIAHEIQNPLNFVNNFSEVSSELIKEMVEEVDKGNTEEVKAIANDVVQNLEKINHHGKRAADIVKGMLQHSRSSSGVKELTDINALCDEYLRLSYHGLRAKDKNFNATMITDYDDSIGNINIIPQDIGRVILNLINNAFYAAPLPPQGGFSDPDYKHTPTVWVSTKKVGDKILISVRDNGPGIPQKILDKIFQPFFTTKPTGQGTGLGLSLSYDIVKVHGGELKVETKEGEGSVFIISIPAN